MSQRLEDLSAGNCNFKHWAHAKSVCPQLLWETRLGSTNIIQLLMVPAISPICFQAPRAFHFILWSKVSDMAGKWSPDSLSLGPLRGFWLQELPGRPMWPWISMVSPTLHLGLNFIAALVTTQVSLSRSQKTLTGNVNFQSGHTVFIYNMSCGITQAQTMQEPKPQLTTMTWSCAFGKARGLSVVKDLG